ncbi:MAG: hypothetical protein KF753_15940 [Caldilineaceae bacterium]|nr:hypothetical protein [Caldilineaceae bacterium]
MTNQYWLPTALLACLLLTACGSPAPEPQAVDVRTTPVPAPEATTAPAPTETPEPAPVAAEPIATMPAATAPPATVQPAVEPVPTSALEPEPDWTQTASLVDGLYVLGNPNAPIRLVDYSDFF